MPRTSKRLKLAAQRAREGRQGSRIDVKLKAIHQLETDTSDTGEPEPRSDTTQSLPSPNGADLYNNTSEDGRSKVERSEEYATPAEPKLDSLDSGVGIKLEEFSQLKEEDLPEITYDEARSLKVSNRYTPYEKMRRQIGTKEWRVAESNRALGYNGHSTRTKRRNGKAVRDKGAGDAKVRARHNQRGNITSAVDGNSAILTWEKEVEDKKEGIEFNTAVVPFSGPVL